MMSLGEGKSACGTCRKRASPNVACPSYAKPILPRVAGNTVGQDRTKLAGRGCLGLYHGLDRRVKNGNPSSLALDMKPRDNSQLFAITGITGQVGSVVAKTLLA